MFKRALLVVMLGSAIVAGACGTDDATGPITYGDTGVLSGGINGVGNGQFGNSISSQFEFLWPAPNNTCSGQVRCSLGVATSGPVGNMTNGGSLFMLISTENPSVGNQPIIQISGVRTNGLTVQNSAQYSALRLVLEWAFLTSRFTPATSNDSAIVRVKAGNDSAVVFKVTSADLQSGRFPQKNGGCGSFKFFDRAIPYDHCTDWQTTSDIDLTAFKDRTFELHFIVSEAAPVVSGTTDSPTVFLFRRFTVEGGK